MSNVTLPAVGAVVATETVSGAEVQVIRLDIGGAGGLATVSGGNPLPVALPGAATAENQQATIESLSDMEASIAAIVARLNSGLSVNGFTNITSAEFARPANTTAYSAMDAVSNDTAAPSPISFENAARMAGGSGYITKAKISTSVSTNNIRYRLNLYSAAPAAIADNALFTRLWADRAILVGWIDFDGMTTEGTGSNAAVSITSSVRLPYRCAGTTLFGLLETRDAFTPTSGQQFSIELTVETN